MPFTKGQSGNPQGRKRGTLNKNTSEIREVIKSIITSNFNKTRISRDLKELSAKQRLDYLLRLMEYIVPKPKSIESEDEKPLTMEDRYQRVLEHIQNNYRENQFDIEGNENTPKGNGGLVTIIPGNYDQNKECNNL